MKFSNILKELRTEKGLTQIELSEALGITRSRLSMYETGDREPDFETLELFADYFNVDVDYLLGRTDKTTRIISPAPSGDAALGEGDIAKIFEQYGTDTVEQRAALSAALNSLSLPPEKLELIRQVLQMDPDQAAAFLPLAKSIVKTP